MSQILPKMWIALQRRVQMEALELRFLQKQMSLESDVFVKELYWDTRIYE